MAESSSPQHDPSHHKYPAAIATQAVAIAIAIVLVVARTYVRASMRRLWWDDLLISVGLVFAISILCSLLVGVHFGIGEHRQDLSLEELREATKWIYIPRTEFVLACMFTRLSIACFLLHIFAVDKKWRRSLYVIMGFIVSTSLPSAFLVLLAQCQPIRKVWDPKVPGNCWAPNTGSAIGLTFNGVISVVSDLTLAAMPIVFLWNIQMTFRSKLGICCIMGLGSLSTACATVRTVLASSINNEDTTYRVLPLTMWATLEVTIGIIAACIPTIMPIFSSQADKRRSLRFTNRNSYALPTKGACRLKSNHLTPDPFAANQALQPKDRNQLEASQCRVSCDPTIEDPPLMPEIYRIRKTSEVRLTIDKVSAREQVDLTNDWGFDHR